MDAQYNPKSFSRDIKREQVFQSGKVTLDVVGLFTQSKYIKC